MSTIGGMFGVTHRARVGLAVFAAALVGMGPLSALAADSPVPAESKIQNIIITEIQTSGSSASEEFIEFFNRSDAAIDFSDATGGTWKLQFYTSTSTSRGNPDWNKPSATVSLSGSIPAYGYYVLAATDYKPGGLEPDQAYGPRLADTGGGLQLAQTTASGTVIHDRLLWKKPASGEQLPAGMHHSPDSGSSLQRMPGEADDYSDEDGELTQFVVGQMLSPMDKWTEPVAVEEPVQPEPAAAPVTQPSEATEPDNGVNANAGQPAPYLTELLPNPAAPQKDESDEYIELYNPGDQPFDLDGYTLQVGTTTLHEFTFSAALAVPSGSYMAFYSRDTRLSLTNTGGQARLLDPAGTVISESMPYGAAADGMAWALTDDVGGAWQWTTSQTPSQANVIVAPVAKAAAKASAATTAAKKTAAKSAAKVKGTTKTKAAKTAKAKKPKKEKKTAAVPVASITEKPGRAPIHTGILVAIVAAAVLYAAYEYRYDLANKFRRFGPNRGARGFART